MAEHINIDNSYNIKEIEVDSSWIKDLSSSDFLEYRSRWDLASQKHHFFDFPLFFGSRSILCLQLPMPKMPQAVASSFKKGSFLKQ